MQEYQNKKEFITEIQKMAGLFIQEFDAVADSDIDIRFEGVDRTPREILAYQLGWMDLILGWEREEQAGREAVTPAPGYKWNQMGELYQGFYDKYRSESLAQLKQMFQDAVSGLTNWIDGFTEEELFQPGGRKWAQSTPSNWPVWKWIHMNTVAPFKSFRSKIRKWKKIKAGQ